MIMIIDNLRLLEEFRNLLSNGLIHVFLWIVCGDIVTGLIKGVWFKKEGNSTKGLLGIVKHLLVVILVVVAYPYLRLMNLEDVAMAFVVFYIAVYGLSILENFGQMGVPFPSWIQDRLEKIKDTKDKGDK